MDPAAILSNIVDVVNRPRWNSNTKLKQIRQLLQLPARLPREPRNTGMTAQEYQKSYRQSRLDAGLCVACGCVNDDRRRQRCSECTEILKAKREQKD